MGLTHEQVMSALSECVWSCPDAVAGCANECDDCDNLLKTYMCTNPEINVCKHTKYCRGMTGEVPACHEPMRERKTDG